MSVDGSPPRPDEDARVAPSTGAHDEAAGGPSTDAHDEAAPAAGEHGWRQTFAALRHRNYRRWFVGHFVSLFGTWMQTTAQGFLAFELTRSAVYLGYVTFAHGLPSWFLMLYGGVVADRVPRRSLLLVTQTAMMLQAALLAALVFTGLVRPWHLVALSFGMGVLNAFDAPARQAFVPELVGREDLTNAIALNSTIFHTAATAGPALAGLVYAGLGPGWCFAANACSFVGVIVAVLGMRLRPVEKHGGASSVRSELAQGVRFAATHRTIRLLLATLAAVSVLGVGVVPLMPAWAVEVLGGDARTNGVLYAARGMGSLGGALMIAWLGRFAWRGRLLTFGTFAVPLVLLLFAGLRWLPASLVILVVFGFSLMTVFNMCNALVQTQTPDELRGRVMSIYTLAFFGMAPIGGLIAGAVATSLGAPTAVGINATALLAYAAVLGLAFPAVRTLR